MVDVRSYGWEFGRRRPKGAVETGTGRVIA
jgi:hypothetical protein